MMWYGMTMAQQRTAAALVQQPRRQHMAEAAGSGIGAAADRSSAGAVASSCSTRTMVWQRTAAALVCSGLGFGICPGALAAALARRLIAAALVQQLLAAARWRWRSSSLQQHLCGSLRKGRG